MSQDSFRAKWGMTWKDDILGDLDTTQVKFEGLDHSSNFVQDYRMKMFIFSATDGHYEETQANTHSESPKNSTIYSGIQI